MVEPLTVASLVANIVRLFMSKKKEKLDYTKQRFMERDGKWRIRILHPNKSIPKCQVAMNNIALLSSKYGDTFEHTIESGGGDNFLIEKSVLNSSKVEIKSEGRIIWKGKFSDLELSTP